MRSPEFDSRPLADCERRLLHSLHCVQPVSELTHNFYRYPARMSPSLPRELVEQFTQPGDIVLDPFMGGGTTIVEALAAGRHAIGVDLNPLAVFLTMTKTRPLTNTDKTVLRQWAIGLSPADVSKVPNVAIEPRIKNVPDESLRVLAGALEGIAQLRLFRQQQFARCVLLRVGQWAIDCKLTLPSTDSIRNMVPTFLEDMLIRMDDFVAAASDHGITKQQLVSKRKLFVRSAVGLEEDRRLRSMLGKVKLVVTSPPYPGIHVLYHRWQVNGRRETPAPYWLIGAQDGHGAAHYTLGGRSAYGIEQYFRTLVSVYRSVLPYLHPDARVVQLVAFSDPELQLPAFLNAMEQAGYTEYSPAPVDREHLWRIVPGRKWYNHLGSDQLPSRELLLTHVPRQS